MSRTIILFAKAPCPGKVKTRLSPPLAPETAAELAAAFVRDTVAVLSGLDVERRVLAYAPEDGEPALRRLAADDFDFRPQVPGDLGNRMRAAFEDAFAGGSRRVVIIGSDSPGLPRRFIEEAFEVLESKDVVLGPSYDFGYYLIGLRRPLPELFQNIPWSTRKVLPRTVKIMAELRIDHHLLTPWRDVDSWEDVKLLRAQIEELRRRGDPSLPQATAETLERLFSP